MPRLPRERNSQFLTFSSGYHLNVEFVSGAKLRIVNTAIAVGARIMSARSEASFTSHLLCVDVIILTTLQIWDVTTKRLCVTGIHVKMEPSVPKTKQKL